MTRPSVRVRSKRPELQRLQRGYWVICFKAWWRDAGDKWLPLPSSMALTRRQAWKNSEEGLSPEGLARRNRERRSGKLRAMNVDLVHFVPVKGAVGRTPRLAWWLEP